MRYFPGMTWQYVEYGQDGNGMPWEQWLTGCSFIDKALERGL